MRVIKPVATLEVKRCFVIGDLAKPPRGKTFTRAAFIKHLASTKKRVLKMDEPALDACIGKRSVRLLTYNSSAWHLAEFSPGELGVWRRAGRLPLPWTNRSLKETAEKVRYALGEDAKLQLGRARHAIPGILHLSISEIKREKYLLPIVVKSGTGHRGRSRLKYQTKGDIDDGCMRSIALAVSGEKVLRVYFGVPKRKSAVH